MKPGKRVSVEGNISLQHIFGQLDKDSDVIIQSCCCCQALLNENTGVYGCYLLERECPYETPDPKRCLSSSKIPDYYKKKIFAPKMQKHV